MLAEGLTEQAPAGPNQSASGSTRFGPGWDRQDRWTLRFVDADLERAYVETMAVPARQRLRTFLLLGSGLWLIGVLLYPTILDSPPLPIGIAATASIGVALVAAVWAGRVSLRGIWALAAGASSFSAIAIVLLTYAPGFPVFATGITAAALVLTAIFPISAVRIAGSVAALTALLSLALFVGRAITLGFGGASQFQTFILSASLGAAVLGGRYLEGGERRAFSQSQLVADLHRRIDGLFRQYLSPDVAQALVDDPHRAELGGEVVEVTVLFADLRGYTSFSEGATPMEVVEMLNDAYGAAVPAVFAEGGTIVQFVGDALMAIFNAPLRQADHAQRACRAALALQRAVAGSGTEGRPGFRVGVNTGPALVGNIGTAQLHNFLAIGDTTNVAARLQSYAPEHSVVIGERTYGLVSDVAQVRPLGAANLKGKAAPTKVFELLSM
jgi:class 3 adenylate cyclase